MNTFSTKAGVVTLSKPYFTLMCDQQQIEVKYTPNITTAGAFVSLLTPSSAATSAKPTPKYSHSTQNQNSG